MSLKLPNDKIVYNLPEQVGVNAENIKYLAEVYKDIDSIPAQFAVMKDYFDDVMSPAFSTWTTTFEGWTNTLDTYLANMSSAAVGAIAGQDIAPKTVAQTDANYSTTFNFTSSNANLELTNVYNRCCVINNILYLIANLKITNTSESNVKIGGAWGGTPFISFSLPSAISTKIFDIDGISAHAVATNLKLITSQHASCIVGTNGSASAATFNDFRFDFTNRSTADLVACYFNSNTDITIEPNQTLSLMARIALTLI